MAAILTEQLGNQREKLDTLRRSVTHRAEELGGRIKDEGLGTALRAGAQALGGLARVGQRIPTASKLAQTFAARAEALDEVREALQKPSIANYDDLNVKQVQDAIESLNRWQLVKTRAYETASKNRKTVLAAIDQRLAD